MRALYDRLKDRFQLGELTRQRPDLGFVTVGRDHLRALLVELKDVEGFTHLVLFTAVDWLEDGQFQLTYLLNNRATAQDLGVRLMIPREGASMDTIHDLWPTAETYQRELYEMFGIDFPGSPRVDEDFILEGWTDLPPNRRDFDTKEYSEATFAERAGRESHDPRDHMKQKLYPDGE
ncbi:NADH-quinone oxidoreductase subunit C [Aliiroseovarius subalbicans]|uniref:NADH-quinone oxidoreductase subunit C n=1 Tax=Aliiroseovarius subalbicans TaxID=2925840 RepID=UPI001F567A30|nr:NADH-quinone oxidoreductase subunit C [Aliiroseovarius subalbicans]MCI2400858.1 NADH-quinone oxidoreductase subunit C [Aliiroseovarius subalbicans]